MDCKYDINYKSVWIEKDSGYFIIKYREFDYKRFYGKFEIKNNMINASVFDLIDRFIDKGYIFLGIIHTNSD